MKVALTVFCAAILATSGAVSATDTRPNNNYMLHCQGCHTPDGSGAPGKVPALKDFMGNFLQVEGGREFLIQVPGVAQSALSDAELAELTNWMLQKFSAAQTPKNYRPYDALEIRELRAKVLIDVEGARAGLIRKMSAAGIDTTPRAPPTL